MITETRTGIEEILPTDENEIKATRLHLLDEYEGQIAGHDTLSMKTDPKVIKRDGLLRALNLERLTRSILYTKKNKDAQGNVIVDEAAIPHSDELFSFNDIVDAYRVVRERHNEMYAENRGETTTEIPRIDRKLAHDFIQDQVNGHLLELAKGRGLKDVASEKMEGEKMFRFPPTEFERKPGIVEEEREVLKLTAYYMLINERKGDWFSASDLIGRYNGLEDSSKYKGEVGMYFSPTSADAFIREKMRHDSLDEAIVYKTYEFDGETYESEETIYRQTPLKR